MRARFAVLYALLTLLGGACATAAPALVGPDAPLPDSDEAPPRAGTLVYDDGFVLSSEDGRTSLKLGGLFQVVGGAFGSEREPGVDFVLKRMRPEISGRLEDALLFTLEPNFAEDGVELEEAWVGAELDAGRSTLRFGRMKVPFGLEEVRSRRHIDFSRFSILNQFSPAEDHGVFLLGESDTGRWEYGLAVTNGTGASDTTSSKDVAARLMLHPAQGRAGSAWRNFQVGLAGTWGRQQESVGGAGVANELGLPLIRYVPDLALDGRRWRAGLELAWFDGPYFVQGEVLAMAQEMSAAAGAADVGFHGAYLTLARVLTGEEKSFGGTTPARPYSTRDGGGPGAWVLALRLSELRPDDELMRQGLAEPGTFTDRIRTVSLGLNWIPNVHMIVRHSLVYGRYGNTVLLDTGRASDELAFVIEAQLHF